MGGTLSFLVSDLLSNVVMAVNNSGSAVAVQLYEPYGKMNYSWGTMPTAHNYTGQRLDSQSGLLYYNFRWYDPFTGRFVRADTLQSHSTGMNPYAYVSDNPEGMVDPTGHDGITLFGWDLFGTGLAVAPEIVIPAVLVVGLVWVAGDVIYSNIINPPTLGCGCIDPSSASGSAAASAALEEIDDLTDWNVAGSWTSHGLLSFAAEWRSRKRSVELVSTLCSTERAGPPWRPVAVCCG